MWEFLSTTESRTIHEYLAMIARQNSFKTSKKFPFGIGSYIIARKEICRWADAEGYSFKKSKINEPFKQHYLEERLSRYARNLRTNTADDGRWIAAQITQRTGMILSTDDYTSEEMFKSVAASEPPRIWQTTPTVEGPEPEATVGVSALEWGLRNVVENTQANGKIDAVDVSQKLRGMISQIEDEDLIQILKEAELASLRLMADIFSR